MAARNARRAVEFDYESLSLSANPKFEAILARSRARLEKGGGIPAAEVRRIFGLPLAKRPRKRKG